MTKKNDKAARHNRKFAVRTYESDPSGRLRPDSMLNFFQEAASEHAEVLGAGVMELLRKNLTWVLSRYHIKFFHYPRWKSELDLITWPSGHQGLFALREFELKDERDRLLAAATSSWMLIDLQTKRPVAPAERLGPYPWDSHRAVASPFPSLPKVNQADNERSFLVRMSELDWNRHVNHVATIAWALESAPPRFLEKFRPAEIEVDYRGEAFYGETVLCRSYTLGSEPTPLLVYGIVKEKDGKELARLRILWRG